MAAYVARERRASPHVSAHEDRRAALDGADYVLNMVQIGGHEATLLRLAIERAQLFLGWQPRWNFDEAICRTVEWYRRFTNGDNAAELCLDQIAAYTGEGRTPNVIGA